MNKLISFGGRAFKPDYPILTSKASLETEKPIAGASPKKSTVSVVIPAYNEEKNVQGAIENTANAIYSNRDIGAYEIIAIDDGSEDKTGGIIDKIALRDSHITAVHHKRPHNFGGCYKEGIMLAKFENFAVVPGDNEQKQDTLVKTFGQVGGDAEITLGFTTNAWIRPRSRQFISLMYVIVNNYVYDLDLKYYNGISIYPTSVLREMAEDMPANFAFFAYCAVKSLRAGHSYKEIPVEIKPTSKTSATRWKNIFGVAKSSLSLFMDIHLKDRFRPLIFRERKYDKTVVCLNGEQIV
jgi:glycosyltransferase involved in cell wall biosynthesis